MYDRKQIENQNSFTSDISYPKLDH